MGQGPLLLSRRVGQRLILSIDPRYDPQEALQRLLEEGIEISIAAINDAATQVRIGIRAPQEVRVLREELVGTERPQTGQPATEDVSNG